MQVQDIRKICKVHSACAGYSRCRPVKTFDDEARVELLCFLVVGQLFAFIREGVWLRTDHLLESAQIWLSSNSA